MGEEKKYAEFDEQMKRSDLKEEDYEDKDTGEWYRVREISALKRLKISDQTIRYGMKGETNLNSEQMTILSLRHGLVKPDMSEKSDIQIGEWMERRKPGLVLKLVAKISGLSEFAVPFSELSNPEELKKNPFSQPSSS